MDSRLLQYYEHELQFIREMGAEFAQRFPKIAGRLGLESMECADPYVERLLEGFAFLAARVHLQLDAQVPRFSQHLFDMVYPHFLCPTPSMAVVQFRPDLLEGALAEGFLIPRGSVLRSQLVEGEQTACEYRTAHDVTLWPLEIVEAEYYSRDVASLSVPTELRRAKAGIRLRLQVTAGLSFSEIALERLPLFFPGRDELPMHIYEQLMANLIAIIVQPAQERPAWQEILEATQVQPLGFERTQSLLPTGPRSYDGYRLLSEYFAFFRRFLFAELAGLGPAVRQCRESTLDIVFLLNRTDPALEHTLSAEDFALCCTPAVNLFPKRADSIHLNTLESEYHVVPDRTRPLDLEVYQLTGVLGRGVGSETQERFHPFYSSLDPADGNNSMAYYTTTRMPRIISSPRERGGLRSSYLGSEVYLSLVDAKEAPYRHDLQLLFVDVLCTNRDLPLHMSIGKSKSDFALESGAPVDSIRCVAGPTPPRASVAERGGELLWRLVNHLSLNYLSLVDNDSATGAEALRDMLRVYTDMTDPIVQKQIEGVRFIESHPITRQIPTSGPITFGRGLEITLTLEEGFFKGCGGYLLAAVLEQFFSKYVSLNSFTETVLRFVERGEIKRWPMRTGRRPLL